MKHYRQGDVLIYQVGELKRAKRVQGEALLAFGEATGHRHRIAGELGGEFLAFTAEDGTEVTELEVREAVQLVHEEHAAITIPPGQYRVAIQVEDHIDWREARRVVD
ncbi:MAG: hypothetical protein ACFB21_12050 [Opitutales bacterium]